MDHLINGIFLIVSLVTVASLIGAALTLGAAAICLWLKWSPINIKITVSQAEKD